MEKKRFLCTRILSVLLLCTMLVISLHMEIVFASDKVYKKEIKASVEEELEENVRIVKHAFDQDDLANNFEDYSLNVCDDIMFQTMGEGNKIVGLVYDENTGENLSEAKVSFPATNGEVLTDVKGRFEFAGIPSGMYQVVVECEGYCTATFNLPVSNNGGVDIYSLPLSRYYSSSDNHENFSFDYISYDSNNSLENIDIKETEYPAAASYTTPSLYNFTVMYNNYIYEFASNMDEYLYYVVSWEVLIPTDDLYKGMTNSQLLEGYKAQAVAARTYATTRATNNKHAANGYNLCSKECCQFYKPTYTNSLVVQAVDATTNKLVYDITKDRRCDTFFFRTCKGKTKSFNEVWGSNVSYLVSVACPYDLRINTFDGHGVGMCQDGAMGYAKNNYSYTNILLHYYTGTKVINANVCNANALIVGETKRFSVSKSNKKEYYIYMNNKGNYEFNLSQAGSITCTPTLIIYDSKGYTMGTHTGYGKVSFSLSKGEYKLVVSSSISADVKLGVKCNVDTPQIYVNDSNEGTYRTNDYYISGVISKIYKFIPETTGVYNFTTSMFKSDSDTVIVVTDDTGRVIGKNDDNGSSSYSYLSLNLSANKEYYVTVGKYGFDEAHDINVTNVDCKLHISKGK